ncbi:MAG TPA: ATP-binding protein [Chloroflexota bacterium]|nr:ATP-binding protein [Chloroflexota bacterium]
MADGGSENYRDLIENANDILYVHDLDGNLTMVNRAAERISGYTRDELLRMNLADFVTPVDLDRLHEMTNRKLQGEERTTYEVTIRTRDGRHLPLEVSTRLAGGKDGPIEVQGIARDISERKRSERAQAFLAEVGQVLAGSLDYQTTLESIAQLATTGIADWCGVDVRDADGRIQRLAVAHADPAKAALARELLSQSPLREDATYGVPMVLRSGRAEFYPEITPTMIEQGIASPEDQTIARTLRITSAIIVPMVARERVLGAITLVISESGRRFDARDLQLAEGLARHAGLALDNALLYQQAQDAVRLRDEVLSFTSHDLRSPLASIKGTMDLLRRQADRLGGPDAERMVQVIGRADASVARMSAMIDELLDTARLRAGHAIELNRTRTDLVALAERLVDEYGHGRVEQRIRVEAAVPRLVGEWDAQRLGRVLDNLLSNAVKYSPTESVIRVQVRRDDSPEGAAAVFAVVDEGIGIPPADLDRLFEPFRRGANAVGQQPGVGLGLAGARRIAELHGGTIAVTSQEGHGTTATLRLPMAGST